MISLRTTEGANQDNNNMKKKNNNDDGNVFWPIKRMFRAGDKKIRFHKNKNS